MKNAEKLLLEIITKKFSENEARELCNSFIKPDVDTLMKSTRRGKNKKVSTLNVLNNIESIFFFFFDGVYLDYSDKPSESEESIAERTKLRRQRFNEITKKTS